MREETVTPELVDTEIRAVPLRQSSPGWVSLTGSYFQACKSDG